MSVLINLYLLYSNQLPLVCIGVVQSLVARTVKNEVCCSSRIALLIITSINIRDEISILSDGLAVNCGTVEFDIGFEFNVFILLAFELVDELVILSDILFLLPDSLHTPIYFLFLFIFLVYMILESLEQ